MKLLSVEFSRCISLNLTFGLATVANGDSRLPDANAADFEDRGRWARAPDQRRRRSACTRLSVDGGRTMLAQGPSRIDNEYLSQFAEFIQFRERNRVPGTPVPPNAAEIPVAPVQTQTPDETSAQYSKSDRDGAQERTSRP